MYSKIRVFRVTQPFSIALDARIHDDVFVIDWEKRLDDRASRSEKAYLFEEGDVLHLDDDVISLVLHHRVQNGEVRRVSKPERFFPPEYVRELM